jgi:hypothetical protein
VVEVRMPHERLRHQGGEEDEAEADAQPVIAEETPGRRHRPSNPITAKYTIRLTITVR